MTMSKTHKILAALLGAQLLLAGALAWWSSRGPAVGATSALFAFDKGAADKLTIEGPDKARVELARKDDRWVVPQAGDFAADANQVTQLLSRLSSLKTGAPVATSGEAAERFKVADTGFERRIAVEAGGKPLATLLLGSSQGARQTFARKGGDAAVLSVDLAAFEVPTRVDDWLDRTVLQVPRDDVVAIVAGGLTLVRHTTTAASQAASAPLAPPPAASPAASAADGDPQVAAAAAASAASAAVGSPGMAGWTAEGLSGDERLDPAAADKLLAAIADLRFTALRGRDDAARRGLTDAMLVLTVQRRDGQRIDYRLYKLPGGEDEHALVLSSRPETFGLASYQARPLLEAAARSALVRAATTK